MKLVILPRTQYRQTIGTKTYRETYFGNVLYTNADSETIPEWSSTATYNYLDEVKVGALNTKYTATVDNPKGHPSASNGWFGEGLNANRMTDRHYTTQTVFSAATAVVEFGIFSMTHLIAQNLDNVKSVTIEYIKTDGTIDAGKTDTIDLYSIESFDCDSCCNPEPVLRSSFVYDIVAECAAYTRIRVTLHKDISSYPILVGVMTVGRSYDMGCALVGFEIGTELPKGIEEFPAIQATGVRPVNITRRLRGDVLLPTTRVDDLIDTLEQHGAYLNFYMFDDRDVVKSGVLLGRFMSVVAKITTSNKTTIPVDIVGIKS